jgi:hypothetical protein
MGCVVVRARYTLGPVRHALHIVGAVTIALAVVALSIWSGGYLNGEAISALVAYWLVLPFGVVWTWPARGNVSPWRMLASIVAVIIAGAFLASLILRALDAFAH